MQFNPEQKKAIETVQGHVLVLAGAGSGKTSVLIQRCIHLLKEHAVSPSSILGLTFTNKAAEEIRKRIVHYTSPSIIKELTLSTFHSFCFSLLKQEIHHLGGYTNAFTIYDEKDSLRLLQTIENQLKEISGKQIIEPEQLEKEFAKYMKAYNAVSFDGLLTLTLELFKTAPLILEKYQNRFQYIMIDEYQDTNALQFAIANLLAKKSKNLFVVGDDDQAIYSWRGAKVQHILEFNYQTLIKLEQNYRSTQPILDGANALIKNNQNRHDKTLWSARRQGDKIHLFHTYNDIQEAQSVVKRLIKLKEEKGLLWKDFAILYRSNKLSRPFEFALMKAFYKENNQYVRGIPYRVIQGTEFYARAEIKDLFAYLKVLVNPLDQTALLRILNYPRRGISINTVHKLTQYSQEHDLPLWETLQKDLPLTSQAKRGIASFLQLFQEAKKMYETTSLKNATEWLVERIALKKAIQEEFKSEKTQQLKGENIQMLISMTEDENATSLHEFLSINLLDQVRQDKKKDHANGVHLLTFHSAKGLEFPACFLVALEDRLLPHERSLLEGNLEEERRLFYVALTRAKHYLTLSLARTRSIYGKEREQQPSRFLYELPKELLQIEPSEKPASFTFSYESPSKMKDLF